MPEECTFEEGGLGHYIVVFHDWVEDPEALAQEQVRHYGGVLGFVYKHALKGYSAEYPPQSAQALQAEPSVKYVEVDQIIWMDDSSGVIQWYSCPAAPPLGPAPPDEPDLPEEPVPPEESPSPVGNTVEPADPVVRVEAPKQQAEQARPHASPCKRRAGKGKRCGSRPGRGAACKKREANGRAQAVAKCPRVAR